jgi:hypothetical protein
LLIWDSSQNCQLFAIPKWNIPTNPSNHSVDFVVKVLLCLYFLWAFERFRITLWFLLVIAPHILMRANKWRESESERTGININQPSTYRQSVNNEWKNIMEKKKIIIIYCVWWSNITKEGKKNMKRKVKRFLFTVQRFTCIRRLLIFASADACVEAGWYFKVCYVDEFIPFSRYPFILSSFSILSLSSVFNIIIPYPSVYFFSKNWIIYLRG